MQKCSIKIECQEISQSPTTMHKQCQRKVAKNCHPENNWGQIIGVRSTLIWSIKGDKG
jgi:hypothetical protein